MKPVSVEVIAPMLTDLRHCGHCEFIFGQTEVGRQVHREELDEYPQDLREDFVCLTKWDKWCIIDLKPGPIKQGGDDGRGRGLDLG